MYDRCVRLAKLVTEYATANMVNPSHLRSVRFSLMAERYRSHNNIRSGEDGLLLLMVLVRRQGHPPNAKHPKLLARPKFPATLMNADDKRHIGTYSHHPLTT